ncbi:hypothetical protein RRG08_016857 [Elysia crispata]|uniref:Uncharacterized protein n=1 Tax=Elysia crispata TaxID=231223 RepID=A0AAE1CIP6_9GAST|nr:hypothetical protein RRG08_016857 [Elysia crispata]
MGRPCSFGLFIPSYAPDPRDALPETEELYAHVRVKCHPYSKAGPLLKSPKTSITRLASLVAPPLSESLVSFPSFSQSFGLSKCYIKPSKQRMIGIHKSRSPSAVITG